MTNPYPLSRLVDEVAANVFRWFAFNLKFYAPDVPPAPTGVTITFRKDSAMAKVIAAFASDPAPLTRVKITSMTLIPNVNGQETDPVDVPLASPSFDFGTYEESDTVGAKAFYTNEQGTSSPPLVIPAVPVSLDVPPAPTGGFITFRPEVATPPPPGP